MLQTLFQSDRFVIILRLPIWVVEFSAYSAAMAFITGLCLWLLFSPPARLLVRLGVVPFTMAGGS
jgi:hypothetical protein